MQPRYMTEQTTELTHQVRFTYAPGSRKQRISCNCRVSTEQIMKGARPYYSPFGLAEGLDEARELYNDPANHWAPFSEGDKAKW